MEHSSAYPAYTVARGQGVDGEDLLDHLSNEHDYAVNRLDSASDRALLRLHRIDHATGRADHDHVEDPPAKSSQQAAVQTAAIDELAAAAGRPANGRVLRTIALPEGQLRVWEQGAAQNDLGGMYVLDVLGVCVLIRQRDDGLSIQIDGDADSERVSPALLVSINNGGEQEYTL